jgi:hypothetical protein
MPAPALSKEQLLELIKTNPKAAEKLKVQQENWIKANKGKKSLV